MRVLPLKPQAGAENLSRANLYLHTYAVRNSFLTTLVFTPATMSGLLLPRLYVDNSNLLPGAYRRETTAESASSKIHHALPPGPSILPVTLLAGATVNAKVARQPQLQLPSTGHLLIATPFSRTLQWTPLSGPTKWNSPLHPREPNPTTRCQTPLLPPVFWAFFFLPPPTLHTS